MSFTDQYQQGDRYLHQFKHDFLAEGEEWWFRRHQTTEDSDRIVAMVQESDSESNFQYLRARILQLTHHWTLRVPEDFVGENGKRHKLAGQVAPLTLEWVAKIPSDVIVDAVNFIDRKHGTRTAEQEKN